MTLTIDRRGGRRDPGTGEPKRSRTLNRLFILAWRLGLGVLLNIAPRRLGRVMVLSSVGRNSGRRRRTPLTYAPGDQCVYTVSSGAEEDWYRNVMADPRVEIWLPEGRFSAFARRVDDPEERLRRLREVLMNQGPTGTRYLDVDPVAVSDDELGRLSIGMQVVKLSFDTRLHGTGRDLSWIWLAAGLGTVAWWKFRKA
jgi:deazaflavin-dependent oxidoreductase (nitroreductase family)